MVITEIFVTIILAILVHIIIVTTTICLRVSAAQDSAAGTMLFACEKGLQWELALGLLSNMPVPQSIGINYMVLSQTRVGANIDPKIL